MLQFGPMSVVHVVCHRCFLVASSEDDLFAEDARLEVDSVVSWFCSVCSEELGQHRIIFPVHLFCFANFVWDQSPVFVCVPVFFLPLVDQAVYVGQNFPHQCLDCSFLLVPAF